MVEVSFENLYPIAGLLIISVTIWGMSRKFTQMDLMIQTDQKNNEREDAMNSKDIQRLQQEINEIKKDIRELYEIVLRLQQKIEDKVNGK